MNDRIAAMVAANDGGKAADAFGAMLH
jgi:hypothetical protein